MATDTETARETNRRQREKGKYIVLKEVTDAGQLTDMLARGDVRVFVMVAQVEAKAADAAIRSVAITDDAVIPGRYVAPPKSSFRISEVKSVPQLYTVDD